MAAANRLNSLLSSGNGNNLETTASEVLATVSDLPSVASNTALQDVISALQDVLQLSEALSAAG